jgi:hypothetical protein
MEKSGKMTFSSSQPDLTKSDSFKNRKTRFSDNTNSNFVDKSNSKVTKYKKSTISNSNFFQDKVENYSKSNKSNSQILEKSSSDISRSDVSLNSNFKLNPSKNKSSLKKENESNMLTLKDFMKESDLELPLSRQNLRSEIMKKLKQILCHSDFEKYLKLQNLEGIIEEIIQHIKRNISEISKIDSQFYHDKNTIISKDFLLRNKKEFENIIVFYFNENIKHSKLKRTAMTKLSRNMDVIQNIEERRYKKLYDEISKNNKHIKFNKHEFKHKLTKIYQKKISLEKIKLFEESQIISQLHQQVQNEKISKIIFFDNYYKSKIISLNEYSKKQKFIKEFSRLGSLSIKNNI